MRLKTEAPFMQQKKRLFPGWVQKFSREIVAPFLGRGVRQREAADLRQRDDIEMSNIVFHIPIQKSKQLDSLIFYKNILGFNFEKNGIFLIMITKILESLFSLTKHQENRKNVI